VIAAIICGLVMSVCGEAVDGTYRESSKIRTVPTLHLVVDGEYVDSDRNRGAALAYHVQSDRPVERTIYIALVTKTRHPSAHVSIRRSDIEIDVVGDIDGDGLIDFVGDFNEDGVIDNLDFAIAERAIQKIKNRKPDVTIVHGVDEVEHSGFEVILAGETQSKPFSLISEYRLSENSEFADPPPPVPMVEVALLPAHERAALLPRKVSYTDTAGRRVEKTLLVEYPFNPYNVGSPAQLSVEWQKQ